MAAPNVVLLARATEAAPKDYVVPNAQEIEPLVVRADIDGTGAAGAFEPTLQVLSPAGDVIFSVPAPSVAAGGSASVTWAPFLRAATTVGAAATPPPGSAGSPFWLVGGYSGLIEQTSGLLNYYRLTDAQGHSYLDDEYGGSFPSALVEQVVSTPLQFSHTFPPPNQSDDYSVTYVAVNPNSGADSPGDYLGFTAAPQISKWGAGTITNVSFECWARLSSAQGIISALNGEPSIFNANVVPASGGLLFVDYSASASTPTLRYQNGNGSRFAAGTLNADDVTWYHIVLTVEQATQTAIVYINGVEVARDASHGVHQMGQAQTWLIGGNPAAPHRTFVGSLAEVALYNRALTPSEVLLHYNGRGPSTDTGRWLSVPYSAATLVGGLVGTDQLAAGAVTTAKIATGAVTTNEIADGTITATDISATLKPSGGAAAGTEALRALGTTASTAMAGNDVRLLGRIGLAYSASITPNAALGSWQTIIATNGTAFTINAPTNPPASSGTEELTIEIANTSGGALGAITWNAAFVLLNGAFVAPANNFSRYVTFRWSGNRWVEQNRAPIDY